MKKFFLMLLAVLVLAGSAMAAAPEITATAEFDGTEITVKARYKSERYTLSLPGMWDASKVVLAFDGRETLRVGKEFILNENAENDLTSLIGTGAAAV